MDSEKIYMGSLKIQINVGAKRKPEYAIINKFVYKMSTLYSQETLQQVSRHMNIKNLALLKVAEIIEKGRIEVGETKVIGN